jgi:thioredoxin-dependent peroxiredoxin
MTEMLRIGDKAPDFSLPDQDGKPVKLSDLTAKSAVVLYFYPKDFSMGCTAEACTFRDSYEDFLKKGAVVVGVSADDAASHARFRQNYLLPFTLLTDKGWKTAKLYGVKRTLGIIPGRYSFVIDRHGIVRYVFTSQFRSELHTFEALRTLDEINRNKTGG